MQKLSAKLLAELKKPTPQSACSGKGHFNTLSHFIGKRHLLSHYCFTNLDPEHQYTEEPWAPSGRHSLWAKVSLVDFSHWESWDP